MTKRDKPPTLAALRKLAKRTFGAEARLVLKPFFDRSDITSGCVWIPHSIGGSKWVFDFNGPMIAVRAGLFAALSALPDKGAKR